MTTEEILDKWVGFSTWAHELIKKVGMPFDFEDEEDREMIEEVVTTVRDFYTFARSQGANDDEAKLFAGSLLAAGWLQQAPGLEAQEREVLVEKKAALEKNRISGMPEKYLAAMQGNLDAHTADFKKRFGKEPF